MRRYFFLFLLILILSGCRKNFIISKIEIKGIKHSSRAKIKNILQKLQGKNLLFFRSKNIINEIKKIDFIKNVEYQKTVPNILKINIVEYHI
ncbi:FtsQ-type POTRA domain-containing protein, partial [bacterium]|nr:FtsQ-type POTRA domain-containing protein [bacterium]